ncbi:MAG: hypothetical protein LBL04_00590 [Bacteroidales bacterium]|jgi:hypothetical protein|nr:hypothetical protein [Bacteroidales bacterium]
MNRIIKNPYARMLKVAVATLCVANNLSFVKFFLRISLLVITGMIACENATDDDKSQVIEKEINGIAFKFCLLNEHGKPATVFGEGENFNFYFSVANQSKKDFYYNAGELSYNKSFLCVYDSSGFDFGKSYHPLPQRDIGIAAYPFKNGSVHIIKVPWLHEKDSVMCAENFCYKSHIQKPLVKGSYYTGFKYSFYLQGQQDENTIKTDSINFQINFKIQ